VLVGASCVEVKTEADSIAVTECSQDDNSTIGMFPISDDIFSVFRNSCGFVVYKGDKFKTVTFSVAGPTFWNRLAVEPLTYSADRLKAALKRF